jgi:hypothetical protein
MATGGKYLSTTDKQTAPPYLRKLFQGTGFQNDEVFLSLSTSYSAFRIDYRSYKVLLPKASPVGIRFLVFFLKLGSYVVTLLL